MSAQIDERVVEMRFDNKQFESGAKETMNTLDRLKASLDLEKSAKSFENLDKAAQNISLDGIAAGVEALQKRFSTLGIIGMQVIENLTNSLMNFVNKGLNFVTDSIVSGGIKRAMNIENAHFQLQALLKDEEKVQAIMDDAMDSVTDTAYAYDEAAKAASQFAATGLSAGEDMQRALKGITGVAAMTNSEYEGISRIFTTVAGNGRLMGDQLLQLSSRGLNAAVTISDFMNNVNNGSVEVNDNIKTAVMTLTEGLEMSEADIREFVSDGKISFDIFAAAMGSAFGDSAKRANETFTGAFANMKASLAKIGAGFISPIVEQNSEVVLMFNAIKDVVNEVKKALVFDESIGNIHALSKQFTDTVLGMAASVKNFLQNVDVTKPMEIFYYWVEIVKNGFKAIGSILGPIAKAFRNVFLSFNADDILKISDVIETFTYKLKLSEKSSKNLQDTFEGLFSIGKLLVDIFFNLLGAIIPLQEPTGSLIDLVLSFTGAIGRAISQTTEWIKDLPIVTTLMEKLSRGIRMVADWLQRFFRYTDIFFNASKEGNFFLKILDGVKNALESLGIPIETIMEKASVALSRFRDILVDIVPEPIKNMFQGFIDTIKKIKDALSDITLDDVSNKFWNFVDSLRDSFKKLGQIELGTPTSWFGKFAEKLKELGDILMSNQGINAFVTNAKAFFDRVREAFSLDNVIDKINAFRSALSDFVTWIKDWVNPILSNLSFGGVFAAAGGGGILYTLIKMSKAMDRITGLFGITSTLGSIRTTLKEFQKDLRADQLKKLAEAILIFAAALTILSFADMNQLIPASAILTAVSVALILAFSKLESAMWRGVSTTKVMLQFAKGFKSAAKNIGKAIKIKAIGSAIKSFAEAVAIIVAAIVGLALVYKHDQESVNAALLIVAGIMAALLGTMVIMSVFGSFFSKGSRTFATAATGMMILSFSLSMVVSALAKLFKVEFPDDWKIKLGVLAGIMGALGLLTILIGAAAKISGGNAFKANTTLLVAVVSLTIVIKAMKKLFEMDLPEDYKTKLTILGGIFAGLAVLILSIGAAGKLAGGAIKAGGTILTMALFIGVVVGALMVLCNLPEDAMMSGAFVLESVLATLAWALLSASKITNKNVHKVVLAMAVTIAAITMSLGLLSMIGTKDLLKASTALGSVLLSLAVDFKAISKITSDKALGIISAMAGVILLVAGALYVLSDRDWKGMLSGAVSMGLVLAALSLAFFTISKAGDNVDQPAIGKFLLATLAIAPIAAALYYLCDEDWKGMLASGSAIALVISAFGLAFLAITKVSDQVTYKKIGDFLLMTLAVVPIGAALYLLAMQDWQSMLAAGVALSATVAAFGLAFLAISFGAGKVELGDIGKFLLATLAVVPIGIALVALSAYPWEGLLASAGALSMVIVAISLGFFLIAKANPDLAAIGAFVAACASTLLVTESIKKLCNEPLEAMMTASIALSMVILAMSVAMAICAGVAKISSAGSALQGIGLLDAFLVNFAVVLTALGAIFNHDAVKNLMQGGAEILKMIASAIGEFVGNIIGGVLSGITDSFPKIGTNLSGFMDNAMPFIEGTKKINSQAMEGVKMLAETILILTAADILDGLFAWLTGGSDFVEFGRQLCEFGPYIKRYGNIVSGIDSEAVQASAAAAQIMADMADTLPNSGGLIQKILGEKKTLSDFAKELVEFGPSIKSYGTIVKGIDGEAVEASAQAAQIMADMADTLPNTNGLAQKIFGEKKTLSQFGDELIAFGPAIVSYSQVVRDVDVSAVEASRAAADIMAGLYDNLPSVDGLAQKIFGETKSIGDFGEELRIFGASMRAYSNFVKDIDGGVVQASANSAMALASIYDYLPETGGWLQMFKGESDISEFGSQLKKFGESLANYYDSIKLIAVGKMGQVTDELQSLIKVSKGIVDIDYAAMNGFSNGLKNLANAGIDGFITAFENASGRVKEVIDSLTQNATTKFKEGLVKMTFQTIATDNVIGGFLNGFVINNFKLMNSIKDLCSQMVQKFKDNLSESTIKGIATNLMMNFLSGINSKKLEVMNEVQNTMSAISFVFSQTAKTYSSIGSNMINAIVNGMNAMRHSVTSTANDIAWNTQNNFQYWMNYNHFYNIGSNAGTGLRDGLNGKIREIQNAATAAANGVATAMTTALKIHSPSRVTEDIGENADKGLANGLLGALGIILNAGKSAANQVINPIQSAIMAAMTLMEDSLGGDLNPVITPTLDLSYFNSQAQAMSDLWNGISTTAGLAYSAGSGLRTNQMALAGNPWMTNRNDVSKGSSTESNQMSQVNNFYITGADPRAIAEEVEVILQRNVDRRVASWA